MSSHSGSLNKQVFRSFSGLTSQKISTENDELFHQFPNNQELQDIINDKKLKIRATEYKTVMEELNELLEEAKNNQNKYWDLYKESQNTHLSSPKLLVEVISGHNIQLSKQK